MKLSLKTYKYQEVPYMLIFSQYAKVMTISTIEVVDGVYETCYFYHTEDTFSNVMETYDSVQNAIDGHYRHCACNGMKASGEFNIFK